MLRQKYVAGTHRHPIYAVINLYTVHISYSSAWNIPNKIVERH